MEYNSVSHGVYNWMGGISHINSSQKSIYHYNIVEMNAHERTFYGSGQTVTAAEEQAKAKSDLFLRIRNSQTDDPSRADLAELLCGHAACPARLYRDPLPSKEHVSEGKQWYVSDRRMSAMLNPQQNIVGPSAQPEPKVDKIRKFIAGLPNESLLVIREILCPEQEFWDGKDLISKGIAWNTLKFIMQSCNQQIFAAKRIFSPKKTQKNPIFEYRLSILGFQLAAIGESEEFAIQNVSINFLLWIRKQTFDILLKPFTLTTPPESLPLNPKIPEIITNLVKNKLAELLKLVELSPDLRREIFSKHVAAVVLQEFSTFRIISLACGNGTILKKSGEISKDSSGFLIKDCHAEILALRAAKLFLYDQLELFLSPEPKKSTTSIFTGGPHESIMMKRGLGLHLYVGQKPCGSPTNCSSPGSFLLYEKCGTDQQVKPIPTNENENRNENRNENENRNRSENLRIISCFDKIQKKCFVGIQGHFLSQLILPVYLGVVVIGSDEKSINENPNKNQFFLHSELERKISEKNLENSIFGFDAVSPIVVTGIELAPPTKPQNDTKEVAFCYYTDQTCGKTLLEYLDPETGKQLSGSFSLLCKRALFLRFRSLYDSIPPEYLPSTATLNPRFRGTYLDCKSASIDYISQKEFFLKLVNETSSANQNWIRKNPLSEKFTCVLEPRPLKYSDF